MSGGTDKGKVIAGVFIGMVLGITASGGVAWYMLKKNPTVFLNKEDARPAPQAAAAVPAIVPAFAPPLAASGVEPDQHFEFYKELTGKSDALGKGQPAAAPKPHAPVPVRQFLATPAVPAAKDVYYVQAGSFQNVGDAEKLKARLALSGFEASLQTVAIPEKGTWHRVRLGPFSSNDAGKTIAALKQNGIAATQQHAQ
jgi:cell division protein FtsN